LADPEGYGTNRPAAKAQKLSNADKRIIFRLARTTKFSSEQLKRHLKLHYKLIASAGHIRKMLRQEAQFKFSTPKPQISLNKVHKVNRKQFAKIHLESPQKLDVLLNCVFTDYVLFTLDGITRLFGYWWDPKKDSRPACKARQNGGGSLMVWAGMCTAGKTGIHIFKGKQNSQAHCQTLEKHLLQYLNNNLYTSPHSGHSRRSLQQDNATIHKSLYTSSWLKNNNVDCIEWPSKSPDLNPIENLWFIMKMKVYRNNKQYEHLSDLKNAIEIAWNEIDLERDIMPLIHSLPKRLLYVAEHDGELSPY
jgi:hypothetical protein